MTQISRPTGKLLLRAERRGSTGENTARDFLIPVNLPVRLGREPRQSPASPGYDPDFGADLVVRGDSLISNCHATLTWDGSRLRVVRWTRAKNLIYVLDPDDPASGRTADDFAIVPFERFRIGNTVFMALPDVPKDGPVERTISGEELRNLPFADPTPRIEALAALPELIRLAPDDSQLIDELLTVLLRGVPRADFAAVVAAVGDGVVVRSSKARSPGGRPPLPSKNIVLRAVRGYENVQHIWTGIGSSATGGPPPTMAGGTDWAVCIRLSGGADEGLYVGGLDAPADADLTADLKFVKLAGDIYAGLRDLRALQKREGFLNQMLTPVVRHALAGQPFDEVTAPRELPVTVLFCDLRGSVTAVAQHESLMGAWEQMSQALDVMTEGIVGQDGVVGDFQGDAAMGFWGWPMPQDDQIDRAARAALYIRRKFHSFSTRKGHPLAGFQCGIGIAHGPAIAGRLGASDQIKIGVFGPAVNRAARLESATKPMGVPIIVDDTVLAHLSAGGHRPWGRVRRIARVRPQGITVPVAIGELLPPESEPGPNLSETNRRVYEAALERFQAGDWIGFGRMIGHFPPDGPLRFLKRFIDENHGTPPEHWDGGVPVAK